VEKCLDVPNWRIEQFRVGKVAAPYGGGLRSDMIECGRSGFGASLTTWTTRPDGCDRSRPHEGLREGSTVKGLDIYTDQFEISAPISPYNYAIFSRLLHEHPCSDLREHVLDGIKTGWDFSYEGDRNQRVVARNWGQLQTEHQPKVWEKILKEVRAGSRRGPLDRPPFPNKWCPHQPQEVPTGTVSKEKWNPNPDPNKFRIVNDFTANFQNTSRSDGEELEADYFQVLHLIMLIMFLGQGCIIILWDVIGAYRTLDAKPKDWHLQVSWLFDAMGCKKYFVDLVNPFGRIESQRNWEALAGAIEWIMHDLGAVFVRHYVDNFFDFIRPGIEGPDWGMAQEQATWIFALMKALGTPFHEVQIGTSFTTLGWFFDTLRMIIAVTEEKRTLARRLLGEWTMKTKFSLRELERFVGFLHWLSLAFYELTPFLGRLLAIKRLACKKLAGSTRKSRDDICMNLSKHNQSDIILCHKLLNTWNGSRSLWDWKAAVTTAHICGDASEWGFGAYFIEAGQYFYRAWTAEEKAECFRLKKVSMMQLETRAIVASISTWAKELGCKRVQIVTDNKGAYDHGNSGTCKQIDCQRTIRALWAEKMKAQCTVDIIWWDSKRNFAADFLSRDLEQRFLQTTGFANFSRVPESHPPRW
jgi:hypothetical protein